MGYPFLNQLPLLSIWPSSKTFENPISMATYLPGRAVLYKKVGLPWSIAQRHKELLENQRSKYIADR
jgi:hypothetical protein